MMSEGRAPLRAGRYRLHGEIASGGMATVHFGQMVGAHGFSRVVAIKRMLPRLARDPRFHSMFVEEAKLASRVQHPNVVSILDVVDEEGEIMIVMEYVRGPALSRLLGRCLETDQRIPVPVLANIGCAMLAGLHAAHEAKDRRGRALGIVHRDVSPQNVLVGVDGVTRIMDFGIAKATELLKDDDRELTGKVSYMAPEQFQGAGVDRRTDVFATAVVLWSALAGRRLFRSNDTRTAIQEVLRCEVPALGAFRDDVSPGLETALGRALNRDRSLRYETAEAFAGALEAATSIASTRAVADWVKSLAGSIVADREQVVVHIEKTHTVMTLPVAGGEASELPTLEPTRDDVERPLAMSPEPDVSAGPPAPPPRWSATQLAGIGVAAAGLVVSTVAAALLFGSGASRTSPLASGEPELGAADAALPTTPAPPLADAAPSAAADAAPSIADATAVDRPDAAKTPRRPPVKRGGGYMPPKP